MLLVGFVLLERPTFRLVASGARPKKKPPGRLAQGAGSASAMGRSPSGKKQGLDERVLAHRELHADKCDGPGQAHPTCRPGSTLLTVRAMLRGLGRSIVVAALVGVVVAAGRAVLG